MAARCDMVCHAMVWWGMVTFVEIQLRRHWMWAGSGMVCENSESSKTICIATSVLYMFCVLHELCALRVLHELCMLHLVALILKVVIQNDYCYNCCVGPSKRNSGWQFFLTHDHLKSSFRSYENINTNILIQLSLGWNLNLWILQDLGAFCLPGKAMMIYSTGWPGLAWRGGRGEEPANCSHPSRFLLSPQPALACFNTIATYWLLTNARSIHRYL